MGGSVERIIVFDREESVCEVAERDEEFTTRQLVFKKSVFGCDRGVG